VSTLGDRLVWQDGEFLLSQCACCRHKVRGARACAAFPEGIPTAVLINQVSHAEPIEGDNGIRLDPVEVSRDSFERMTRLPWPAGSMAYSDVEDRLAAFASGSASRGDVMAALHRADLLVPLADDTPLPDGAETANALTMISASGPDGQPRFEVYTSQEKLIEQFGEVVRHVRMTLDNFPAGFGGLPMVVNPGDPAEFAVG
jgi:hypothetical protein